MITSNTKTLSLAFGEITKELDLIIGEEVHRMYKDLIDIAEDIHVTRAFKRGFSAPKRLDKYGWRITNSADHSVVLAQGRHIINGRAYGSLGWYYGIDGNFKKLERDIKRRFDKVKR